MFLVVGVVAEEAHELGDSGLDGDVAGTDDTYAVEVAGDGVLPHLYGTSLALGDVEHYDAALYGLFDGCDEPCVGWGVAGAVGLYYDGLKPGGAEDSTNHFRPYAGEELEDGHACVEPLAHLQWLGGHGQEEVLPKGDVDACYGQRRVVVGLKGVEILGAELRAAVAAVEVVLKEYAHLWDDGLPPRGYLKCADDVLAAVGTEHAQRQLAAGEDDGFGEVLEHEAQGRGGVGHGVGAVEHHKAVVVVVGTLYDLGNIDPHRGRHVRRVDDVVEGDGVDAVAAVLQLWHSVVYAVEGEGVQRTVVVLHHADGAAGIHYKHFVFHTSNNAG